MVAASARRRDLPIKSADPRAAAMMMLAHDRQSTASPADAPSSGRVAMLFGPEASGLDNDEVVLADILVTAPLNPSYPSLNLAQAVLLMAWEWRMAAYLASQHGDAAASDQSESGSIGKASHAGCAASLNQRARFFLSAT